MVMDVADDGQEEHRPLRQLVQGKGRSDCKGGGWGRGEGEGDVLCDVRLEGGGEGVGVVRQLVNR